MTITIFLVFLVIEILIFFPAYQYYRQQQIDNLNLSALSITKAILVLDKEDWKHLIIAGNKIAHETTLKGLTVYSPQGSVLARFGTQTKVTLNDLQLIPSNSGFYFENSKQYVTLFDTDELQLPYKAIAVVNSKNLNSLLHAFVVSYVKNFLLAAFLLTLFIILIVGFFILHPIIKARKRLLLAIRNPSNPHQYLIKYIPNFELGEIFKITNTLLLKVGSYLSRLNYQQEKLTQLNKSLDSKVKQRTMELSQRNIELELEVTQRQLAEKELFDMALFPKESNNPVLRINHQGMITYANPASESLLRFWKTKVDAELPIFLRRISEDALTLRVTKTTEMMCNDQYYLLNFVPIAERNYVNLYGADITQRKHYEEQIQYLSGHDSTTGLINRSLFENLLLQIFSEIETNQTQTPYAAIILLSISDFDELNQALGHILGEALLKHVAVRLSQKYSHSIIAYLGTNIFALGISHLKLLDDAETYAENIIELFKPSFLIGHQQLHITVSLGIAIYPLDAKEPNELIKNADLALFHARSKGQNTIQFFTESMNKHLEVRHRLFQDLHLALSRQEFFLCYQPQINLNTNKIVGVETLLRWHHPILGLISPNDFIPLLESSHLIDEITEWMVKMVAEQHIHWKNQGLPALRIAINFTANQLLNENLISLFEKLLDHYPIQPNFIELEITERLAIVDPIKCAEIMSQLHHLGLKISIDDFGSDYSSLRYLHQLEFDKIKIDKSFIHAPLNSANENVIVKAMINLAHNLNLQVLAEGVETEEQFNYLKSSGCDEAQGFFIAKPMTADELVEFYFGRI